MWLSSIRMLGSAQCEPAQNKALRLNDKVVLVYPAKVVLSIVSYLIHLGKYYRLFSHSCQEKSVRLQP